MDEMRKAFGAWADMAFGLSADDRALAWAAWQAATLAEREACAAVCEAHIPKRITGDMEAALDYVAPLLADAIRSRTE